MMKIKCEIMLHSLACGYSHSAELSLAPLASYYYSLGSEWWRPTRSQAGQAFSREPQPPPSPRRQELQLCDVTHVLKSFLLLLQPLVGVHQLLLGLVEVVLQLLHLLLQLTDLLLSLG